MISFWRQLKFLLWKCILIKKRQKFWLFIELLVPIILFAILALVRTRDFTDSRPQCHYDSKGFPSSGLLPFLHSQLCSFNNPCHSGPSTGDQGFWINNQTEENESIIVDILYYGSLQLEMIGEDPQKFEKLLNETIDVIKIIGNINGSAIRTIKLKEWFDSPTAAVSQLQALGMSENTATVLSDSQLTPLFYIEMAKWYYTMKDSFGLMSIFDFTPIPVLCNPLIFDRSFILPPGLDLTATDRKSLCKVSTSSLIALEPDDFVKKVDGTFFQQLPLLSGGNMATSVLLEAMEKLLQTFNAQPIGQMAAKWNRENITENIRSALFCGNDPLDTLRNGMVPKNTGAETPFDKMKQNMIRFIEGVVPGQDKKHEKQYCMEVPVHDDLNCSSLETALLRNLRPIIQGYILVTPPSPITEQLIKKLNGPLQQFDYLRRLLYEWPGMADAFQESLHDSILYTASQNLLAYLRASHQPIPFPSYLDDVEFALEHLFNNSSDPYALGELTKDAVEIVNHYTTCFLADRFVMVDSEPDMEQVATCLMGYEQYFSGIVFSNLTNSSTEFQPFTSYKIRHHPSFVDGTSGIADSARRPFNRDQPFTDLKYITFGFSYLQEAIDRAIISISSNYTPNVGMFVQQEPYPCVTKDNFNISNFLGLFVILSFIVPASLLVKNIVYEKEQRIKEQMRIMGLGDSVHFVSWAIISFAVNFLSVVVISVILRFGKIFNHTDFFLILTMLTLFAISSVALSLLLSTLFTNANISTAATCIVYFLFFFPFQLSVKSKNKTFSQFTLMFPQTTLGYATMMLAQANEIEQANWRNIHEMYLEAYDVSFIQCLIAFAIESLCFVILAWYISAIFPGVYGVGQRWYFPFTLKYWCPQLAKETDPLEDIGTFDAIPNNINFEVEPTDQKMTVHIQGMSKVYDSGTKALDSLNLRLYENQITALLGHNGAGKTTTMSILCGLYAPSSGSSSVYGFDIRRNMRRVRDVLGICPQHNVLFPLLTVSEQLKFFAALKGTANENLKNEVVEIMESVGLTDKSDALANTLSGGMKRRLCIGIALIGGSKFVILDEPTAGVDVNSRKDIWKLLQNNKKGRTILLSTHHMDEADVLSDRAAVLSEGKLIALGSPVFLKNKYGKHIQLIVCKQDRSLSYKSQISQLEMFSNISAKLLDETEDELVFGLPIDAKSSELEAFFAKLDEKLKELNFSEYGISAPTLQQIFVTLTPQREYVIPKGSPGCFARLRSLITMLVRDSLEELRRLCGSGTVEDETQLLEDHQVEQNGIRRTNSTSTTTSEERKDLEYDFEPPPPVTGVKKLTGHVKALLSCRFNYTKRSGKTTFFEVILPILLLLFCEVYALIAMGGPQNEIMISQNPLPLVSSLFGNYTDSYVNVLDRNTSTYSHRVMDSFTHDPDMGIRCSKNAPKLDPLLRQIYQTIEEKNLPERYFNMLSGTQCDYGISSGSFDWSRVENGTAYNEDVSCECTDNLGWNCTAEDYPLWTLDYLVLNTTERIWDLSYRNLSQMRMDTRWSTNESNYAPFFLGGFSLGHHSVRAQTNQKIEYEKQGWRELLRALSYSAVSLNWNLSSVLATAPSIDDPFIQNITLDSFVDNILENMDVEENVKVWFNNKLWPALPIYASSLSSALLRTTNLTTAPQDQGILTFNHPMNQTVKGNFDSNAIQKVLIFRIVIICLVLCVIPAGFTVFLVEDRISDSYHLQKVSGLAKRTYWLTGYLFDMIVYSLSTIVILLIYLAFGIKEFCYNFDTMAAYFLLFMLYGLCAVVWAYNFQRYFRIPALSFVLIAVGTFFIGIVTTLTVIIIEQMMQTDATLVPAHTACSYIFLILPQYNLGMAIFRGSYVYQLIQMGEKYLYELNRPDLIGHLPVPSVLTWNLMGLHCFCLFVHIIISLFILVILEHGSFGWLRRAERSYTRKLLENDIKVEDDDVLAEKEKVNELKEEQRAIYPLVVTQLAKAYSPSQLAVRGVSFAVEKGECFGLLGLNGAGKTTTFGMLTGKLMPGSGTVQVNGYHVRSGDSDGFTQLGYCPQFDALNPKLTTMENLVFFARIRGIPESEIKNLCLRLLRALHLRPYSSTLTSSLSGGNRRKLSVAIALISQPSLILLDEPSAGMDPGSQQFLWKVIEKLRKSGKAVIMTSHSMEECEALCTRIAIMDKGKIRCLGSKQHLKNKFGEGYSLTLKTFTQSDAELISDKIKGLLGKGAVLEAIHCNTVFYHIDKETATITSILHAVNQLKSSFPIEDFSLTQATLSEVFQSLATRQWNVATPTTRTSTLDTNVP